MLSMGAPRSQTHSWHGTPRELLQQSQPLV